MKKTIFLSVLALTLFINSGLLAKQKWSKDLGQISWSNAYQKCKKQGMRLPSGDELEAAGNSAEAKNFRAKAYWTNESVTGNPKLAGAIEFCYQGKKTRICGAGNEGKKKVVNSWGNPIHARCVK